MCQLTETYKYRMLYNRMCFVRSPYYMAYGPGLQERRVKQSQGYGILKIGARAPERGR